MALQKKYIWEASKEEYVLYLKETCLFDKYILMELFFQQKMYRNVRHLQKINNNNCAVTVNKFKRYPTQKNINSGSK